jgi:hypothetical protein
MWSKWHGLIFCGGIRFFYIMPLFEASFRQVFSSGDRTIIELIDPKGY